MAVQSAVMEDLVTKARELFESKSWLLPRLFSDPAIYELEKEKIFSKTWVFLAHESEIPKNGDYVIRYIADDSFIVCRTESGEIKVLFNMCRHRGMQVCRVERGNAAFFRCPYHGWTYKNTGELIGVPFQAEAYGPGGLDKSDWPLVSAPKVEIIYGMIFANLDPNAPSLAEYLGGAEWYLALYLNKSTAGMEVLGGPQRWVVPANWKLGADNFIGDAYHTGISHMSTVEVGILPVPGPDFHKEGAQVHAGHWGGGFMYVPPGSYMFYPPSVVESMRRTLTPQHWALLEKGLFLTHSSLFPNLSFLNAPGALRPGGQPFPYMTIRAWRPVGPDRMEIWSWCLVEKDAPEEFKQASYRAYVLTFGTSGTLEQDDTENWSNITRVSKGVLARQVPLNYRMGLGHLQPMTDWPGPGKAYPIDYTEFNQRHFWRLYFDYLSR